MADEGMLPPQDVDEFNHKIHPEHKEKARKRFHKPELLL
jgi:hypothetical protein